MRPTTLRSFTPSASHLLAALALATVACTNDGAATTTDPTAATSTGEPSDTTSTQPTGSPTSTGDTGTTFATDPTGTAATSTSDSSTGSVDPTTGEATSSSTSTSTDTGTSTSADTDLPETFVKIQILAFNDFHGQLEPPGGSGGQIVLPDASKVAAGGAAFLATHIAALRADNPNTIVVSAGDLIGGSPLVSALFHDEPTIEVMNTIGLDYNAVGNHEFDNGAAELVRMQKGGCSPIDGCLDGTPFAGASFEFLAANVLTQQDPIDTLFPSYAIHQVEGVKIAFIGMTLTATPQIVTPSGIEGLSFVDEVARANALVPELTAQGVEAIVLLIHEGGFQGGYFDECDGISGPIVDIVTGLADEIDLVITGHTHQAYNCIIADRVVTSAASLGRVLTDIDLEVSSLTGHVTALTASNVVVTREAADPEVDAYVSMYAALAAPLADKPIGDITATLERYPPKNGPGLSTMGLVLADAHLAATAAPMFGGSEIAFMNLGGVRASLLFAKSGAEAIDGVVRYAEAFAVQPFGNSLVVMTLTGAQLDTLLEQQFSPGEDNVLQPSKGFKYTWSKSAPIGAKVDPATITLNGVLVDPAKDYRVTVISYLAAGGDSFDVLVDGTDRLGGVSDMEALVTYFADHSPLAPPALDRVTLVP